MVVRVFGGRASPVPGPKPWDTQQTLTRRHLSADLVQPHVEAVHSLIKVPDFLTQLGQHLPHRSTEPVLGVLENLRQVRAKLSDPLSDDDSVFEQETADLIDHRRTLGHRLAADPVHVLQVLLLDRLHRDEPHRRSAHRFADRLRVAEIILVRLHVRLDELCAHHTGVVPELPKHSRPMMRSATGFEPDQVRRLLRHEAFQPTPGELLLDHHLPVPVHAADVKRRPAEIDTDSSNLRHGSLRFRFPMEASILAL